MLLDVLLIMCALVLLAGVVAVLAGSRRAEVSLKAAAAFLVGGWAIWLIARAVQTPALTWPDLLGPAGVALWVLRAMRKHCGRPMRRCTDFTSLDDSDERSPS